MRIKWLFISPLFLLILAQNCGKIESIGGDSLNASPQRQSPSDSLATSNQVKDLDTLLNSSSYYLPPGEILHVLKEDFLYEVADPSAEDYHLQTKSEMKLYVLEGANGLSIKAFGTKNDRSLDDTLGFQSAIDAVEAINRAEGEQTVGGGVINYLSGSTRLDSKLKLTSEVKIDFGKSELELFSPDIGFDIGWGDEEQAADPMIVGGRFMLREPKATGIAIQNSYAPVLKDINLRMYEQQQIGLWVKANKGIYLGPYYGVLDNIRIYGNSTPGDKQVGMRFSGSNTAGSDGINRWTINNIRHVAAVDYCMEIENMHGQAFNNVNLEACYNTGIRFNYTPTPYHSGAVTSTESPASFIDTSFKANSDTNSASVIIISGANSGQSQNVLFTSDNRIVFPDNFPFEFSQGDRYQLFLSKARDVTFTNVTQETAGIFVDFRAGARNCKVHPSFVTVSSKDTLFRREIEDMNNTIANRYSKFTFQGTVKAGGGEFWLSPSNLSSVSGGVSLSESGWIDAVFATGGSRTAGSPGLIRIEAFAGGESQNIGSPLLTPSSPTRARRVRKELKNSGVIGVGKNIKVRASADASLIQDENVRVEIYVGHL